MMVRAGVLDPASVPKTRKPVMMKDVPNSGLKALPVNDTKE
jgi:hypothetical protein